MPDNIAFLARVYALYGDTKAVNLYKRLGYKSANTIRYLQKGKTSPGEAVLLRIKAEKGEDLSGLVAPPIIIVGAYTGLREGDVMRLTAEDLRERPGWIKGYGSKRDKPVWLPVVPELKAALDSLGVVAGRLFRRPDGTPFRLFPRDRWNATRTAAGLSSVRFHDLRHCVGTLLAEAGVPQRTIQAFLGHASGAVTERYTRPQEQGIARASRALARRLGPKRIVPPTEPSTS